MEANEQWVTSISRQDWSLDRRGAQDEARHNEKVKESIQDNLENIVSDGNIITVDPTSKRVVKVPLRTLELPRFRFGEGKEGIGTGKGDEQAGDVVQRIPAKGKGTGAGDQPGEEYYEAELSIEEIQGLVFADLGLPFIKPKEAKEISTEVTVFDDIRKKRSPSNLDLSRTVMQNMMRNAQESGKAEIRNISPDDYRVRMWREEMRPENNAVIIAMADVSGSMGDFEKYITRAFCWWSVGFLRSKYPAVEIVFVAHDTEAHEVSEEQFFTRGMGGGTKCSSANKMALDLVESRYPTSRYNVYPMHFSDGDNYYGDNEVSANLVQQLLERDVSQYAYVQIGRQGISKLLAEYNGTITNERFKGLVIDSKEGVLAALKKVFNPAEQAA